MKISDWFVDYLISKGVTQAFGLPGAVILDLLYALERRKPEIEPHLSYHEQGAGFAACGYAQHTGKLGVAYATRGPGSTNMLTAVADAYYDSLPVMFITAHSSAVGNPAMRIEINQEMNLLPLLDGITKYAARIDRPEEVCREVRKAYDLATTGRKGPVFLDFSASLLGKEMEMFPVNAVPPKNEEPVSAEDMAAHIAERINAAKCPVFLIGNGVRQSGMLASVVQLAERNKIPVLSSRVSQDLMPTSCMYYGHIGSHATRYSNFILDKADLVISLGNRMAFPINSQSFRPIVEKTEIIRVDVDATEFLREIPNCHNICIGLEQLIPKLLKMDLSYAGRTRWLGICNQLKETLWQWDKSPIIEQLMELMTAANEDIPFICDVGNHSFWETNAYAYSGVKNRILYSGSFGVLGCALPKAIGVCCAIQGPVICFTGDQGLQMNLQELEMIQCEHLPVTVVVLNNFSSGMIREREVARFHSHFVHTTTDSGYGVPDFKRLAESYKMHYICLHEGEHWRKDLFRFGSGPCFVELQVNEDVALAPNLPRGSECQNLSPFLPDEIYQQLNGLGNT